MKIMHFLLLCTPWWTIVTGTLAEHRTARSNGWMSANEGNEVAEYCTGEAFEPRCTGNDVIVMLSSRYGRMKLGRCVEEEPGFEPMLEDPRYLGCFTDVLDVVSRQCSGRSNCTLRVNDQNFNNVKPCYANLKMYLEATYMCISVAAETRYCTVSVSSGPQHIVDFGRTRQQSETLGSSSSSRCGDESRPWTVEALNGQRISVSLIDFTTANTNTTAAAVGQAREQRCNVRYGEVMDKAARKNVSICRRTAEQDGGRLSRVYVSQSNFLHITFTSTQQRHQQRSFIVHLEAVGCSDLVSPSDGAWLRRDGDEVVVGCYTSRQSWRLRCVDGRWTGTVGLCQAALHQQHIDHHQHQFVDGSDDDDQQQEPIHNFVDSNFALLSIVAVTCSGIALCLLVVCVGVACLRRQSRAMSREKSCAADAERLQVVNGSIDSYSMNLPATNDDVNLQWHSQQQQQQHQQLVI